MNVIYEQELEEIAGTLGNMGFTMYPMSSGIAADVVLYVKDAHGALSARALEGGTALLCVKGMNAAQIGEAIRRRSCQQLF